MCGGNFAASYSGMPSSSSGLVTVVNTVEVPHFDLKEDPLFGWITMYRFLFGSVLSTTQKNTNGYHICSTCATVAFVVVNRLSEASHNNLNMQNQWR
ncbi:phragmoplast orienting kinesin 2 [Hibiscus trionum]|uniref:Phragmoplast orienting kinesin 2 n=1 Tax=Hibiscus trionum TaxID=183268 RepID=A0A9W7MSH3_HIBTR|nr:phragmoplast orienting kinesin 2 [Hibiscus trionum]